MGRSVSDPNREPFYSFVGVAQSSVLSLNQIHSKRIISADDWYDGIEADGILSVDGTNTLGITTADCLPVFIFHPKPPLRGSFSF